MTLHPEAHSTDKPCLACRYLIKGNEKDAAFYWCDPARGGCGHSHAEPNCPEIQQPLGFASDPRD